MLRNRQFWSFGTKIFSTYTFSMVFMQANVNFSSKTKIDKVYFLTTSILCKLYCTNRSSFQVILLENTSHLMHTVIHTIILTIIHTVIHTLIHTIMHTFKRASKITETRAVFRRELITRYNKNFKQFYTIVINRELIV